jgi:hypothetical protein
VRARDRCTPERLLRVLPIVLVLALSLSVKLWQLDENPAGFFTDEAGIGYDAYLIEKAARTGTGNTFRCSSAATPATG